MEQLVKEKRDEKMVTYSTELHVNGKTVCLEYSTLVGYLNMQPQVDNVKVLKTEEKTHFEKCFLWPVECFLPPVKGTGAHMMYQQLVQSNYNQSGKWHELRWSEVK